MIYGGGIRPLNAFYFGLYGGSEMPGVLETDRVAQAAYLARGYEEIDRTLVLTRDLATFEATVDRRQMQIRRQMVVEVAVDPPSRTWWEACILGEFDLTRFALVPRGGGPPAATATFRSTELTDTSSPGHVMALIDLVVAEAYRRRGLAIFLLSEAFRQFARQGITTVEAQAMQHNVAALGMYRKLNFQQIGQGSVFRKAEGGGRRRKEEGRTGRVLCLPPSALRLCATLPCGAGARGFRVSFQRRCSHQYCCGLRRMAASNSAVYHCVSAGMLSISGPPWRGSRMASRNMSMCSVRCRRSEVQTATRASCSIANRAIAL